MEPQHLSQTVEAIFAQAFYRDYQTTLKGGAGEPLYLPFPSEQCCPVTGKALDCATIYYREDFFFSALHEVAHWCIAGVERRQNIDFGYWYVPDGRTATEQQRFLWVEQKPQALEWLFSMAAGCCFQVSADNLNSGAVNSAQKAQLKNFKMAVHRQAIHYLDAGLPTRAEVFMQRLADEYHTDVSRQRLKQQLLIEADQETVLGAVVL